MRGDAEGVHLPSGVHECIKLGDMLPRCLRWRMLPLSFTPMSRKGKEIFGIIGFKIEASRVAGRGSASFY